MLEDWNYKFDWGDFPDYSYIIKAKNDEIEIQNTIKKRIKSINKKTIIIMICVSLFPLLYGMKAIVAPILFWSVFCLAYILYNISNSWILRATDNKIDVKFYLKFRHITIDYSDLIQVQLRKIRTSARKRNLYYYALVIEYIKNGKIKNEKIVIDEYLKPEIENLCKIFITNKQFESNPDMYYYGYIDINERDNEKSWLINTFIKKLDNKRRIQIIILRLIAVLSILYLIFVYYDLFTKYQK